MSLVPDGSTGLRRLHLVAGACTIVLFVLTGQYMHWVHGHLQGVADGPRLFLRSAHIYLLWSGIANMLLGCHLARIASGARRHLQTIASVLLLASAPMLAFSFFCEAYNVDLTRPIGWWANVLAFIGVLAQPWVGVSGGGVRSDSSRPRT